MLYRIRPTLLIFLVYSFLHLIMGCSTAKPLQEASEVKWGHLEGGLLPLTPDLPMFLINKKAGAVYRICLAESLSKSFAGIESEIEAAINIWAYYLGRSIPVDILKKQLPSVPAKPNLAVLMSHFTKICGENFDLFMVPAPLAGELLGQTSFNYSYQPLANNQIEIVGFHRYMFLRDLAASPLNHLGTSTFESFSTATGLSLNAAALLDRLKQRDQYHYALQGNKQILPVLIHEFGHVWGLCDQYEGPANCDVKFTSSHTDPGSQMGASNGRQMLYLTDDDIEGIRHFLKRDGFGHDFVPHDGLTDPVSPAKLENFEFAQLHAARLEPSNKLVISYSVVTHVATELRFAVFEGNSQTWVNLEPMPASDESGLNRLNGVLNVLLGENFRAARVRMILTAPNVSPPITNQSEIAVAE